MLFGPITHCDTPALRENFTPSCNMRAIRPGHHMTVLQSLPKTVGLHPERMAVLDTLRRKRNLSDYSGEDVDTVSVAQCTEEAERLFRDVADWLAKTRPDLVSDSDIT